MTMITLGTTASMLGQPHSTQAMQAPGVRQPHWEAEILCLELSREEGLTPGQLVQRALRPSIRVAAQQVKTLQQKATSPALGSSPHLLQGDCPRPWQESNGHAGQLAK